MANVDALIDQYLYGNINERDAYREALVAQGESAVREIFERFEQIGKFGGMEVLLQSIWEIGPEFVYRRLEQANKSGSLDEAKLCVGFLGSNKDERNLPYLIEAIKSKEYAIVIAAMQSYRNLFNWYEKKRPEIMDQFDPAVPVLLCLLDHENKTVVDQACECLRLFDNSDVAIRERVVKNVIWLLKRQCDQVRGLDDTEASKKSFIQRVFGTSNAKKAARPKIREISLRAIEALGSYGAESDEGMEVLCSILQSEQAEYIKKGAMNALAGMGKTAEAALPLLRTFEQGELKKEAKKCIERIESELAPAKKRKRKGDPYLLDLLERMSGHWGSYHDRRAERAVQEAYSISHEAGWKRCLGQSCRAKSSPIFAMFWTV